MSRQLVQRAVADDPARGQHILQLMPTRHEPGRIVVVARQVPGHVEQRRRRGPPDRRDEQVADDFRAVFEFHRRHVARSPRPADALPAAGVHDPDHLDTDIVQVLGGGDAFVVGGEHHRSSSGSHRVQVDQPARRRGEHDPGQVVALEDIGPFDEPGRDDEHLGAAP